MMEQKLLSKTDLTPLFKASLQKFGFLDHTICRHLCGVRDLLSYMELLNVNDYSTNVGKSFSENVKNNNQNSDYYKKTRLSTIHLLDVILEDKPYIYCRKQQITGHTMHGEIGSIANVYVDYLRKNERLSATTLQDYIRTLSLFTKRMEMFNISLDTLNFNHIVSYISSIQNSKVQVLSKIKRFVVFLHSEGYITEDFSWLFKGIKAFRKEKLPSTYPPEDIIKIEQSVDRTSSIGKRDYAIILLASRLGLRSSDIRMLCFSNLDWENNNITLCQFKTKREIILPLLPSVGDALIDYILHGRPESKLKQIFLSHSVPYRVMAPPSISSVVCRYIYQSGIQHKGKHTGCHSLRHSLATALLQNGNKLSIISETLGHGSSESTMYYLKVNITQLLKCSNDVPCVSSEFYTQKGGVLYD